MALFWSYLIREEDMQIFEQNEWQHRMILSQNETRSSALVVENYVFKSRDVSIFFGNFYPSLIVITFAFDPYRLNESNAYRQMWLLSLNLARLACHYKIALCIKSK